MVQKIYLVTGMLEVMGVVGAACLWVKYGQGQSIKFIIACEKMSVLQVECEKLNIDSAHITTNRSKQCTLYPLCLHSFLR